ncbi:hypothetical protein N9K49_04985 [Flavobacteriaceae bacterium]|nr:hypothetical protein [Flavobacteriaceae bacterium]
MNPTLEIVGTLVGIILTSITAYGALTLQRSWFTLGICFFSTIPIIGEALAFAQDDNLVHLALVMVFLVQVVITLPLNIRYGVENPAAMALAQKIRYAILTANLCQGCLILNTELEVPHQFGYLHLVVALIMLYTVVRSNTKKEIH